MAYASLPNPLTIAGKTVFPVPGGAAAGTLHVRRIAGGGNPAGLVANAALNAAMPYRIASFDGLGETATNRHFLAGNSRWNFTQEIPYTYPTLPTGTNISDAVMVEGNDVPGRAYLFHSGYVGGSNFTSTSLVVAQTVFTQNVAATITVNLVHQIDFAVSGRIFPVPGYATLGTAPIICSPHYIVMPGPLHRLLFMYQPNGLNSTSYIGRIQSTAAALTAWDPAVLISGTAMPYDAGNYASNLPGSYIDPFYFQRPSDPLHYLLLRCFATGNGASTCLGQRIVSATTIDGPYNTLVSNLFTTAHGGSNPYVTVTMEGQSIFYIGVAAYWFCDDYANGGYRYAVSPTGGLQPGDFGPFTLVSMPSTYNLRHADAVRMVTLAPASSALVQIENTAPGWIATGGFIVSAAAPNSSAGTIAYCPKAQSGTFSIGFGGNTLIVSWPHYGSLNPTSIQISVDGGATVTIDDSGATNEPTLARYTRTDCGPGRHTVVFTVLAATDKDGYVDYIEVEQV